MISKDLAIICGENKISIINVNQYKLIREIKVHNSSWIKGVCMLNKNTLLTGDDNAVIRQWKIKDDNLVLVSKKEKTHDNSIYALLNMGDGHIASGSYDKLIKIW
jgi:WD40 repeat protein